MVAGDYQETNQRHFNIFKEECRKWLRRFGLLGWEVDFAHDAEESDSIAWNDFNAIARHAKLVLNAFWPMDVALNDKEVRAAAFHEVDELRFARIRALSKNRYVSEREIDEEVHNLIQTDQNVIWGEK